VARSVTGLIAVSVVCVVVLGGCGSSSSQTSTGTPTVATNLTPRPGGTTTSGSTTTPAGAPSCSTFCKQAAPAGGPSAFQCPGNDFNKCARCPASGCITVSQTAHVSGDVAQLQIHCLLPQTCSGAFLLLQPSVQVGPNEGQLPENQWVGGSDFQVPANSSATVPIGLTPLGQQLVKAQNGYAAAPSAVIRGYFTNEIGNATQKLRIKLTTP
jgi:hypothetical protein